MCKILQGRGIPTFVAASTNGSSNIDYLVTEILGPSLEDLFVFCGKKFSLKTSLMLFHQLISLFETVHSKRLIHRDIKPANFLMGIGANSDVVHMIDYGLVRKYESKTTGEHIPFGFNKCLIGTAQYASINAHKGFQLSR